MRISSKNNIVRGLNRSISRRPPSPQAKSFGLRVSTGTQGCAILLRKQVCGAVFSHRSRFNESFRERIQQQRDEKRAVAIAALGYIKDGDTIILDAGTSTLALAQLLKERAMSVFVITCSVPAARRGRGTQTHHRGG